MGKPQETVLAESGDHKENFRCFVDLFEVYYAVLSDLLDYYDRDERNHRDSTAGGQFVFYIAITSKYC